MKTNSKIIFKMFNTFRYLSRKLSIIVVLCLISLSANAQDNIDKNEPIIPYEEVFTKETFQGYRFKLNHGSQMDGFQSSIRLLSNNGIYFSSNLDGLADDYFASFTIPETKNLFLFNSPRNHFRIVADGQLGLSAGGVGTKSTDTAHMTIRSNGYIGIDTDIPSEKLELYNGNFQATFPSMGSSTGIFHIKPNSSNDRVWLGTKSSHNITLAANNKGVIDLNKDGYAVVFRNGEYPSTLNISTANKAKYSLFVLGGVLSEDYSIGPKATWADHVFDTDYKLMDLKEVESFIATNNRLPDIPSASEVGAEGYSLHDMNVKLLQKVEELTLYSIEQNKEIEQLKEIANSYNSLLEKIEKIESKMKK